MHTNLRGAIQNVLSVNFMFINWKVVWYNIQRSPDFRIHKFKSMFFIMINIFLYGLSTNICWTPRVQVWLDLRLLVHRIPIIRLTSSLELIWYQNIFQLQKSSIIRSNLNFVHGSWSDFPKSRRTSNLRIKPQMNFYFIK